MDKGPRKESTKPSRIDRADGDKELSQWGIRKSQHGWLQRIQVEKSDWKWRLERGNKVKWGRFVKRVKSNANKRQENTERPPQKLFSPPSFLMLICRSTFTMCWNSLVSNTSVISLGYTCEHRKGRAMANRQLFLVQKDSGGRVNRDLQ